MQTQQIQETILCCSSPSTSTGSITFHDIRTGAALVTFKQTNTGTHGTDLVETKDGQGGFILSAQRDKSILNVYNYQKVHLERPESVKLANAGDIGSNSSQDRAL
jgi:pre-rRNA-processing protein IPI3